MIIKKMYNNNIDYYCFNCHSKLAEQCGFRDDIKSWVCKNCGQLLILKITDIDAQFNPDLIQFLNARMKS